MRTSNEFSRKLRIGGYVAYGFKDKAFKGGAKFEYMFSTQPWRKLTINLKRDLVQLGRSSNAFSESNIMSSMLAKGGGQRRSPVTELSIAYDHEWSPGFNNTIGIDARRVFSNRYVPMIRPDGELVQSVAATILRYRARFSWDETVTRGTFEKSYVHTKYPYLTFDIMASPKGIAHNDFSFLRAEATLDWRLALPPAGYSLIRLNAGKIQGRVPYPFLKLHEGNGTYFLDKGAFACMEFYEFASDSWATIFVEHNFGGFFLGKVPLLRKLNLREVATFKAAYGTLSDRNNGIVGTEASKDAALLFPISARQVQHHLKLVCDFLHYENISTHSFRKWYATSIYNQNGHDIVLVQRLLQHSSPMVTRRYIGVSDEQMEQAIARHVNIISA
jgi:hypothetical protein